MAKRKASATAGREISATDGIYLRRRNRQGRSGEALRNRTADDDGAHRYFDASASRPSGLPLLRAVRAWLHHEVLFLKPQLNLPAALATRKVTVRPHSVVHSLVFDPTSRKVTGVRVIDGQTHETMEFKAKVVFLCASAFESTRILLHSTSSEFPSGLGNSSGELGRNVMDHVMGGGASAEIPGHEDKMPQGRRPNGIYVPRFRNVKEKHAEFLRGYGFQGGASRDDWGRGRNSPGSELISRMRSGNPDPGDLIFTDLASACQTAKM